MDDNPILEKAPLMPTPGSSIPGATPYDFAYDKDAWTPVVVSPIRTKPAAAKLGETRIFLPDAYVKLHTTIHRPLDSSSRRSSRRRIRKPLAVVAALVVAFLALAAVFFAGRWFGASYDSNSFRCQASAFLSSVAHLAQGQQDAPSFDDVLSACMNPSAEGISLAERRR